MSLPGGGWSHIIMLIISYYLLSRVRLFVTPWTVTYQAPSSMGFSRQEYWSGLHFPSPGDFPNPGIEPGSPAWQADSLLSEPQSPDLVFLLQVGLSQQAGRIEGKLFFFPYTTF